MTFDHDVEVLEDPEPFVIGDPGRAYAQTKNGTPFKTATPSDTECDAFDVAGWSIRAASVRGLAHRQFSEPRQDSYAIRYSPDADRVVMVVCDGVGSAKQSHEASRLAADSLAAAVLATTPMDETEWIEVFYQASDAIVDLARTYRPDEIDSAADARRLMATTASVVVLDGLGGPAPWSGVSASVGDSTAWRVSSSVEAVFDIWNQIAALQSDDGEVASTATSSLPLTDAASIKLEILEVGASELVVVCSDGVSDPFVAGKGQVPLTLGAQWVTPPTAINFAAHVGYGRRTHTDDRTCVALWSPA